MDPLEIWAPVCYRTCCIWSSDGNWSVIRFQLSCDRFRKRGGMWATILSTTNGHDGCRQLERFRGDYVGSNTLGHRSDPNLGFFFSYFRSSCCGEIYSSGVAAVICESKQILNVNLTARCKTSKFFPCLLWLWLKCISRDVPQGLRILFPGAWSFEKGWMCRFVSGREKLRY